MQKITVPSDTGWSPSSYAGFAPKVGIDGVISEREEKRANEKEAKKKQKMHH